MKLASSSSVPSSSSSSTASSSSVFAPSSSSSSNDLPAPKIVETSNAVDSKLWPAHLEKQFIEILLEEPGKGTIRNGIMKKEHGPVVTELFNNRTGIHYSVEQIKGKFRQLKNSCNAFSQLIGRTDMEWDPDTNTVTGSDMAWLDAMKLNCKCSEFLKKGLDHYGLLVHLFPTVAQTSSAQQVSAVDVDEQGNNPKGKQPAHTDTSCGKKRKAGSLDRVPESRKTVKFAQVTDYSMAEAIKILNSMSNDLDDDTMYKAAEILTKVELREALIAFLPENQLGWIKHLTK